MISGVPLGVAEESFGVSEGCRGPSRTVPGQCPGDGQEIGPGPDEVGGIGGEVADAPDQVGVHPGVDTQPLGMGLPNHQSQGIEGGIPAPEPMRVWAPIGSRSRRLPGPGPGPGGC